MTNSEHVDVIDKICFMLLEGKTAKEIAESLRLNEKLVKAVVNRMEITRF